MVRIQDRLIESLRAAAKHNPDVQAAPYCILWTDAESQWEVIIPRLQQELPELFVLGDYDPSQRRGPAIWLRCALARSLPDLSLPNQVVPIFYLPGISRQNLRAVDTCPEPLKPLAELQYRGVFWSQLNAKDWTIQAFLQSAHGGLKLDVATDRATRTAMQLALPNLMDAELEQFRRKRLDRDDFYGLISTDPAGDLLKWLDDPGGFRAKKSDVEWQAFVELCGSQFGFNPETEGPISAAGKLADHKGPWIALWDRYREAARHYTNIAEQIRRANPPSNTLDWRMPTGTIHEGWPQWNAFHEGELRASLLALADQPPQAARKAVQTLEQQHQQRRDSVWADLGEAPLAEALQHLHALATTTAHSPLNGGTVDDLVSGYLASGWRADDAVLRALACATEGVNLKAIETAIRALYLPWAEASARYLQQIVDQSTVPQPLRQPPQVHNGTCVLFVDGLRFDVAQRLIERLKAMNLDVVPNTTWAALPSVTATGKPAVSPVRDQIAGADVNEDFVPRVAATHKAVNAHHFGKLLTDSGWQILKSAETGSSGGKAWAEIGVIDMAGHNGTLPHKLESLLIDISNHVQRLLNAGWTRIEIVTDHGWLYMPGGMPKTDLPGVLTDNQWGRCAAIKPGAKYDGRLYPWYWNPNQHFALADGVSCFRSSIAYAHGGLSLQECIIPELVVTQTGAAQASQYARITRINWRELRCDVFVAGGSDQLRVDIRRSANDGASTVASKVKPLKADGSVSLVVEEEEDRGIDVFVVILDEQGRLIAQQSTVVGG